MRIDAETYITNIAYIARGRELELLAQYLKEHPGVQVPDDVQKELDALPGSLAREKVILEVQEKQRAEVAEVSGNTGDPSDSSSDGALGGESRDAPRRRGANGGFQGDS